MPCLNEAETLGVCLRKATECLERNEVSAEIVVADNGSTDGSIQIAREWGARVVFVQSKGYGNALMGGIQAARGKYVIMGDADDSYDFSNLMPFIEKLREGNELVMGNRFRGGIAEGAMPPAHQYFGNPLFSAVSRLLFGCPGGDIYCGLRGFSRESYEKLRLACTGMEFAVEMVIKSSLLGLRQAEVPTTLSPDGRSRAPHLKSLRDGWRTLRFMLLYSPQLVFLYPGALITGLGLIAALFIMFGTVRFMGVGLDVQTMTYAVVASTLGYQMLLAYLFADRFGQVTGLRAPSSRRRSRFLPREYLMEAVGVAGLLLFLAGLGGSALALARWGIDAGFGPLNLEHSMRLVIPSAAAIILGGQTLVASFFIGLLDLKRKPQS
jgi:glycosyltransferase involved in cell wall biosynthesis